MITEEQARAAVIHQRSGNGASPAHEICITSLEKVIMSKEAPLHEGHELGIVGYGLSGWSCSFDMIMERPDGTWGHSNPGHCYVVEALPGPYVIT